ncbi:hypothetical protein HQQ80_13375 [Microbacteriaceae bacterium VKM Ac-2855]|nr:hypothetical protein [Microbacteriaceae bacterium VKM Ac-2855]
MPASTPAVIPARSETTENVRTLIRALEDPGAIDAGFARHISAQLRAYLCETVPEGE